MLRRTPSIQPKQSASSTDSGQVMLGFPEPFLWKPTRSSVAVSWFFSSHLRKSAGVAKNVTFMRRAHSLAEHARGYGWAKLRRACPQVGHGRSSPLGRRGSVERSRGTRSRSSDAAYASIAAIVALFLRSSNTILSYVSRLVCQVY